MGQWLCTLAWCVLATGAAFGAALAYGALWHAFAASVAFFAWSAPLFLACWASQGRKRQRGRCYVFGGVAAALVLTFVVFWVLRLVVSQQQACGRSPCSSAVGQLQKDGSPWPYSPLGYFPDPLGVNDPRGAVVMCDCGCRWADINANLTAIRGYPPDGNGLPDRTQPPVPGGLATRVAADYYPVLAAGLAYGWAPGATVADVALCPGVTATANPAGLPGLGGPICATCGFGSSVLTQQTCQSAPRPAHTEYWCWVCPPPALCPYVGQLRSAFFLSASLFALALLCALFGC